MTPQDIVVWLTIVGAALGLLGTLLGWIIKLRAAVRDHRTVEETLTLAAEAADQLGMAAKDVKIAVQGVQQNGLTSGAPLTAPQNALMDAAVDAARDKVKISSVITDLVAWQKSALARGKGK
jgi:hypothetical protein